MDDSRHVSFHFTQPNSEQMNLFHWVTTCVEVKVSVSKGEAEDRKKCHLWGYRTSWALLNLIPLQLMGRVTERLIALPGLLWMFSLWCILTANSWQKVNRVPSQELWQEHFALVHSHEIIIGNLQGLSAAGMWCWQMDMGTHSEGKWEESQAFIGGQGLGNTILFALDRIIG